MNCLGCRIINRIEPNVNVVFEDEYISCVLTIEPFNEGHVLILPKKHYHDLEEIDRQTLSAIIDGSVKVSKILKRIYNPDGITICQNGGVFNDLTHYHMHVIPRFNNDGFTWSDPIIEHKAETRLKETRNRIIEEFSQVIQEGSDGYPALRL